VEPAGIRPRVLAHRVQGRADQPLGTDRLTTWLLEQQLATLQNGKLYATARGRAIGAGLEFVGDGWTTRARMEPRR
jgi:hypothetical protein